MSYLYKSLMRVRGATAQDAAGIAAVHVASWEGAYRGLVPDAALDRRTIARQTAVWEELLATGDPVDGGRPAVFVAEQDSRHLRTEVTGFAALNIPSRDGDADAHTAEISALYVTPSAWRGGVGRALMEAALAHAAQRGCTAATLWVLEPNTRARAFYERCGFAEDGGRQTAGEGWPVELRMRRSL